MDLSNVTIETFEPHLGETFAVAFDAEGPTDLVLTRVEARGQGVSREAFSLTFREPGRQPRSQSVYTVSHPTLGEAGIFLVPIGVGDEGVLYEAVFT